MRRLAAKELARRKRFSKAVDSLVSGLFPLQRNLYESEHPRKSCRTGRRGGKSHTLGACIFAAGERYPGETIPVFYRTLTSQAAGMMWRLLLEFNEKFQLGGKPHHTLKRLPLPNGAEIVLLGADTIDGADKHRGNRFPAAFIDEAGTYRPHILEYLLLEVIEPALSDFGGPMTMAGTPGLLCRGPFYDSHKSEHWEDHRWTYLDNPILPLDRPEMTDLERAAFRHQYLEELKARNGWDDNHPKFRREWLGEWVDNAGSQAYRYQESRNCISLDDLPAGGWRYVLGIDLGFNDPTAFVVLGTHREDGRIFVIESYEQAGLIPSAVAAHVERLRARYRFMSIVADTGGYGKGPVEEMRRRYHIPVKAAQKRDKLAFMEFLNGDFQTGTLQVVKETNEDLITDLQNLPMNDDGSDVAEGYADHLPDALLYGHRELLSAVHGFGVGEDTRTRLERLEDDMEALEEERYRREEERMLEADEELDLLHGGNAALERILGLNL